MRFLATTIPLAALAAIRRRMRQQQRKWRLGAAAAAAGRACWRPTAPCRMVTSGRYQPMVVGATWVYNVTDTGFAYTKNSAGRVAFEDIGGMAAGTMGYKVSETIKTSTQLTWYESTDHRRAAPPRSADGRQRRHDLGGLVHAVRSARRRVVRSPDGGRRLDGELHGRAHLRQQAGVDEDDHRELDHRRRQRGGHRAGGDVQRPQDHPHRHRRRHAPRASGSSRASARSGSRTPPVTSRS